MSGYPNSSWRPQRLALLLPLARSLVLYSEILRSTSQHGHRTHILVQKDLDAVFPALYVDDGPTWVGSTPLSERLFEHGSQVKASNRCKYNRMLLSTWQGAHSKNTGVLSLGIPQR
jgi:hypothetical protein